MPKGSISRHLSFLRKFIHRLFHRKGRLPSMRLSEDNNNDTKPPRYHHQNQPPRPIEYTTDVPYYSQFSARSAYYDNSTSISPHAQQCSSLDADTQTFVFSKASGHQEFRGPNHSIGGTGAGPSTGANSVGLQQPESPLLWSPPPAYIPSRSESSIIQLNTKVLQTREEPTMNSAVSIPVMRANVMSMHASTLPTPSFSRPERGPSRLKDKEDTSERKIPSSISPLRLETPSNRSLGVAHIPDQSLHIGEGTVEIHNGGQLKQKPDTFALIETRRQDIFKGTSLNVYLPESNETVRSFPFISDNSTSGTYMAPTGKGLKRDREDEQKAQMEEETGNYPKKRKQITAANVHHKWV